jgi:6-pyruvoyltetrahydropterin/6-carboxytetrahydropterin synthase
MSAPTLAEVAHFATMHRDDAPSGRTARFHARTLFDNLPCCHRSATNPGNRYFLHGYDRRFEIEFACAETEPDGLVLSSRAVKKVRKALRKQFDHTTLVDTNDPERDLFELLAKRGVIELRIMENTGMEGSTAWVFDAVDGIVGRATRGRVWVSGIKAREIDSKGVTLTVRPEVAAN